jgi:hypothetical protein
MTPTLALGFKRDERGNPGRCQPFARHVAGAMQRDQVVEDAVVNVRQSVAIDFVSGLDDNHAGLSRVVPG